MNYPFDIEEVFPGESADAVRLPRRQSGSSPQGLTVTLLADYTVRTGAWLPSAAIVALLTESGVSSAGARNAISRLARRGVLECSRHGRYSSYRLTRPAATDLSVGGQWIASYGADAETWNGRWTLITFSLPQDEAVRRRTLRVHLRWLGYAPLYDALWVSPHELPPDAHGKLAALAPGTHTVFRARHVDLAAAGDRSPIAAWDIPAIAEQYGAFIRRWSAVLPRVRSGRIDGAEAVRTRTEVMDTYRRFSSLDPQLPLELLPKGWLRQPAREVFAAIYDGLADAAGQHVRAVTARYAAGPPPEIHANTVADLLVDGPSGGARISSPGGRLTT